MKIGIDIRNVGKKRTGDEAVFSNVTRELTRIDQHNQYYLFIDRQKTEVIEKIKEILHLKNKANVQIVSLKTTNKFSWNFWWLGKYLRQYSLDIYLTQYITPFFVPKRTKIVTIVHDISFNFYPQFIKKTDLFFLKVLIPLSLKRANKIVAVSQFTRQEIIHYYRINPEKVVCVYNAVADDFQRLANSGMEVSLDKIRAVQKKYKLPEDNYLLYLGTFQPRKNLPVLIKAFGILKENLKTQKSKFASLKLVLAGGRGHNYDTQIDQSIKTNSFKKDIILTGYIDEEDKLFFMAGASIFCFPSFYEGFGIPILESLSVGVPAVVSQIPTHQEIAQDAVEFFKPTDAEELAQKLEKELTDNNLRNRLIKRGKEISCQFSWQETSAKLLSIFQNLK